LELFTTYDRQGRPGDLVPRQDVHRLGLWHKSVQVFVFDAGGDLLLQRRAANKDLYAGLWDYSVGEHLQPGEEYLAGAHRGLFEELGIHGLTLASLGQERWVEVVGNDYADREIQQAFRGEHSGALALDPVEVAEVRYLSMTEIGSWVAAKPADFTPWFLADLRVFGLLEEV
jgi:isopentenyl-diphosphate delta-isomerase